MDGNLFVYVEWFPVAYAGSLQGFLSKQMSLKKVLKKRKNGREQERVTREWTDISRPGPASF